jgi:hypothetical protein
LCENDVDIDANAYKAYIEDAEKLTIDRKSAYKAGRSLYSLENCRKEILCYKRLCKIGKSKSQNIQPYFLFRMLDEGFLAATTGYQIYKDTDLKIDAMTFAKAAEKFGKILGKEIVTIGNTFSYQQTYQGLIDKAGY